jgi:hypothetical protein
MSDPPQIRRDGTSRAIAAGVAEGIGLTVCVWLASLVVLPLVGTALALVLGVSTQSPIIDKVVDPPGVVWVLIGLICAALGMQREWKKLNRIGGADRHVSAD